MLLNMKIRLTFLPESLISPYSDACCCFKSLEASNTFSPPSSQVRSCQSISLPYSILDSTLVKLVVLVLLTSGVDGYFVDDRSKHI